MSVWMVERDLHGITMDALAAAQGAAIAESGKATADAVRQVNDAAGLPYSRIVEALDLPAPN